MAVTTIQICIYASTLKITEAIQQDSSLKDLIARNLWNEEMRTKLIAHNGSSLAIGGRF